MPTLPYHSETRRLVNHISSPKFYVMFALVHHQISDPEKFMGIVQSGAKFPEGFTVHAFIPAVSHQTATCIWEAPDTKALKELLDPVLGNTSVNTYLEVDEANAIGLQALKEMAMH